MSSSETKGRRKLAHDIQDRLLAQITSGAFAPGDALPSEREMMQTFGVGRPAVREAMQRLQGMGLVEIRHGGRARVVEPSIGQMVEQIGETMRHLLARSPATLEHLKEARLLLEVEMARTAARKRATADLARLRSILAAQTEAHDDLDRFVRFDGAFHREIAGISGNPIYPALIDAVFQWLAHFYRGAVSVPGLQELTLEEHNAILEAIEARDPDTAARRMSDHLSRANDLYRQVHYARQD